jgi:hypothetical protein
MKYSLTWLDICLWETAFFERMNEESNWISIKEWIRRMGFTFQVTITDSWRSRKSLCEVYDAIFDKTQKSWGIFTTHALACCLSLMPSPHHHWDYDSRVSLILAKFFLFKGIELNESKQFRNEWETVWFEINWKFMRETCFLSQLMMITNEILYPFSYGSSSITWSFSYRKTIKTL